MWPVWPVRAVACLRAAQPPDQAQQQQAVARQRMQRRARGRQRQGLDQPLAQWRQLGRARVRWVQPPGSVWRAQRLHHRHWRRPDCCPKSGFF